MALILGLTLALSGCVQNATVAPSVTPTPQPCSTPQVSPLPELTMDQKMDLYFLASSDPYVQERALRIGWRNAQQNGTNYTTTIQESYGNVTYDKCVERGPGSNRTAVLPAVRIVAGNASEAGIDLVAFVDQGARRVVYIGFVPRPGAPVNDSAFTAVPGGVDEYRPSWDMHRSYDNVTIVDTGYTKGVPLSRAEADHVAAVALNDSGVLSYFGGPARVSDVSVYSYEAGYPDRYILAYPMVALDGSGSSGTPVTLHVLVDGHSDRVVGIRQGDF